jgi:hypothetical protein
MIKYLKGYAPENRLNVCLPNGFRPLVSTWDAYQMIRISIFDEERETLALPMINQIKMYMAHSRRKGTENSGTTG